MQTFHFFNLTCDLKTLISHFTEPFLRQFCRCIFCMLLILTFKCIISSFCSFYKTQDYWSPICGFGYLNVFHGCRCVQINGSRLCLSWITTKAILFSLQRQHFVSPSPWLGEPFFIKRKKIKKSFFPGKRHLASAFLMLDNSHLYL